MLGDDHVTVEPIERFLAYLTSIERSSNTVKAYAHDLKDWFVFLGGRDLDWRVATLEDVAGFVGWLRLPPAARDGRVLVLPTVQHHCTASSVNRKLAALTSFCEFHARHGVRLAGLITMCSGWFRPLLGNVIQAVLASHYEEHSPAPTHHEAVDRTAACSGPDPPPMKNGTPSWPTSRSGRYQSAPVHAPTERPAFMSMPVSDARSYDPTQRNGNG